MTSVHVIEKLIQLLAMIIMVNSDDTEHVIACLRAQIEYKRRGKNVISPNYVEIVMIVVGSVIIITIFFEGPGGLQIQ